MLEHGPGSCVSPREYYCFKLQIRPREFNILLFGRRLTQQYVVDMYIKIESIRLAFLLRPSTQNLIRADLYQGLVDSIVAGETRACMTGKRIVLPPSFIGGPRDMRRRCYGFGPTVWQARHIPYNDLQPTLGGDN
jgi:hypothetical protein